MSQRAEFPPLWQRMSYSASLSGWVRLRVSIVVMRRAYCEPVRLG